MTDHGAILTIDLDALGANYRLLKGLAAPAELAAVVKADAYGLGAGEVVPRLWLEGCRTFFVATPEEGAAVRRLAPAAEIHVFNGILEGWEQALVENRLIPVLNSPGQVEAWRKYFAGGTETAPADLHVDTGMARLGFQADEWRDLLADLDPGFAARISAVISHLACPEEPGNPFNARQRDLFDSLTRNAGFAARRSLAASSGLFLGAEFRFDMARAGVALYGVNPTPGRDNPMAAVVRAQGRILQIRDIGTSDPVGYGGAFVACRPSRIATVALGYADGIFRAFGERGVVYIGEADVPVAGRVSMDLTTLDITDLPAGAVRPGDLVDFIGPRNPIERMADAAGTIAYEVLTSLGKRYRRLYKGSGG